MILRIAVMIATKLQQVWDCYPFTQYYRTFSQDILGECLIRQNLAFLQQLEVGIIQTKDSAIAFI